MKIGVLGCFYGMADLLHDTVTPWLEVKSEGYDIVLAAACVQFKEYAELGYPDDDQATREALRANSHHFEALFLNEPPMYEKDVRTLVLYALLAKGVDVVWLLDGDEHYTSKQIKDIIAFVEKTPQFDYYHIHFDNRVFGIATPGAFFPPRIIRTNRSGGISKFRFDNELVFNDGSALYTRIPGIVPRSVAQVTHHTWRREDAERKIAYQKKHFGYSSYALDSSGNLVFDDEFYTRYEMPVPQASAALPADAEKPSLHIVFSLTSEDPSSLRSLLLSLLLLERHNAARISLTLLHKGADGAHLQEMLYWCPVPYTLEPRAEDTWQQAVSLGQAAGADLLFVASGEYVYEASTLHELFYTFRQLSKDTNLAPLMLCPVDNASHYKKNELAASKLILGSRKHWRAGEATKEALLIPKDLLDTALRNFDVLMRDTLCLRPIPTLAHSKTEGAEPFSDWRRAGQIKDEPKQS